MAYRFAWKDEGHPCRWQGSGATEEELIAKVGAHVQKKHGVKTPTETIVNYVRAKARQS